MRSHMNWNIKRPFLFAAMTLGILAVQAQSPTDDPLHVTKTEDFTITGIGSAPEWQKATPVTL